MYNFVQVTKYTKENGMAAEHGGKAYKIVGNPQGMISNSGDLGVDWRIILNCKLQKPATVAERSRA
jgi:hypothetical protein